MKAFFHCRHSAYREDGLDLNKNKIISTEIGFRLKSGFKKIMVTQKLSPETA